MKRTTAGRIAIYVVLLVVVSAITEGCGSSKKCGCGPDLNNSWKTKHRYWK